MEAKCKVGLEDLKVIWAGVPVIAASNSLDSIAAVKNRERERERERGRQGVWSLNFEAGLKRKTNGTTKLGRLDFIDPVLQGKVREQINVLHNYHK